VTPTHTPLKGNSRVTTDFPYIFSGENYGENSAEVFSLKMSGKIGIFQGKSLEKLFPREIPRKIKQKINFRRKKS
jgi:hypothetical protein